MIAPIRAPNALSNASIKVDCNSMIFFRSLSKIHALSFDLDDTLYDNHPCMISAEKGLLAFIHSQFPKCKNTDALFWRTCKKQVLGNTPEFASDMGKFREASLTLGLSKCGYSDTELKSAVKTSFDYFYFLRSDFKVDKTICSLLEKLADKVPLVAITNGNVNLQQIGIQQYFQFCLHANLEQPMKPNIRMFNLASEKLAIKPANILHVGDNLEKDVMGAKNAGFKSAWWACNRPMLLSAEPVTVLPDVQLNSLEELVELVL